ncbi:MAG: VRR-NUC domain-containing protein [Clostridia bacterium]|nr:VRR-NUC domain-containing protein [Clostridia bacterium]
MAAGKNSSSGSEVPKKISTPVPCEDTEQEMLFRWARISEGKHPELRMMYAIPNGGYRHLHTAVRMKRTGTKAGVPDICLPVPRGSYHGMYIELKRLKGGHVSEEQKRWIQALKQQGYCVVVAYGAYDAIECIKSYLSGESAGNLQNGAIKAIREEPHG